MEIPALLYHATLSNNLVDILNYGLKTGSDRLIYFADSPAGAVAFVLPRMYALGEDRILCFEVPSDNLDCSLLMEGCDHSPTFFKDINVFTYPLDISRDLMSPEVYCFKDFKSDAPNGAS